MLSPIDVTIKIYYYDKLCIYVVLLIEGFPPKSIKLDNCCWNMSTSSVIFREITSI